MKIAVLALCILGCYSSSLAAIPEGYCPPISRSTTLSAEDDLLRTNIAKEEALLDPSNARLVDAFYRPCGYAAALVLKGSLTSAALAMLDVVKEVSEKGLNPKDYVIPQAPLATIATNSVDMASRLAIMEIKLTIAALRLATDLYCGRIDPHSVHADLVPHCQDFSPTEFLWHVSQAVSPAREYESLEPIAPGYQRTKRALRNYLALAQMSPINLPRFTGVVHVGDEYEGTESLRSLLLRYGDLPSSQQQVALNVYDESLAKAVRRFQSRHGLDPNGTLNRETYSQLTIPVSYRVTQLAMTLERWRWVSRTFAEPPIVVNIPEFKLRAYDATFHVVLAMKVIVGGAYHRRTPVFENQISSVIFRPYWNIPPSIQRHEIEPAMRRDPHYLQKHDYEVVRGEGRELRIRQLPGDRNALGLVKFSLPNTYNVYLHGTPVQSLFDRTRRDFSHGCIRVADPTALAQWVLRQSTGWTREKIVETMYGSRTMSAEVARPIPILIVYATGFAAEDDTVYFLADIYEQDMALAVKLRSLTISRRIEDDKVTPVLLRKH